MRICEVNGCGRKHRARGWCSKHLQLWYKHGDPLGVGTKPGEPAQFFAEHVDDVTDDCILWPYGLDSDGYGRTGRGGFQRVHILSCVHHHGPRPSGKVACHVAHTICGNRHCFNGRHVFWGDPSENTGRDRVRDGTVRVPSGETHPLARLSDAQIQSIRDEYAAGGVTQQVLADKYGTNQGRVSAIVLHKVRAI